MLQEFSQQQGISQRKVEVSSLDAVLKTVLEAEVVIFSIAFLDAGLLPKKSFDSMPARIAMKATMTALLSVLMVSLLSFDACLLVLNFGKGERPATLHCGA